MKRLTEAKAWEEIARRIEVRDSTSGLCMEALVLRLDDQVSIETRVSMKERLLSVFGATCGAYLWPEGEVGPRVIAATLLSKLAKEAR